MNLFFKRPLLIALSAFLFSSIIISRLFHFKYSAVIYLTVLLVSLVTVILLIPRLQKRSKAFSLTVLLAIILALLGSVIQFLYFSFCLNLPQRFEGEELVIEATIEEVTYQNGSFAYLNAKAAKINGEKTNLRLKFELNTKYELKEGAVFKCVGNIEGADSLPSDERNYLIIDGCAASVSDVSDFYVVGEKKSVGYFLSDIRNKISTHIENNIEGESGALMSALLLGKDDSLDTSIKFDFRRTGISHMLALSGMHLSIMMSLISIFLDRFNLSKRFKAFILILLTVTYVALSGFSASILRAAFMYFMASLSFFSRRENDSYTSLFFAVSLIILIQPVAINDIGLWLSFLATLGIIIYSELFSEKLKIRHKSLRKRILQYISISLWISFFAFLFTLPITALIFGEISIITPLSNLIFAYLINFQLILSFLAPFLCDIRFFARICELLGDFIISAVNFLANLNGIYISVSYVLFYIALALFFSYIIYLLWGRFKIKDVIRRTLYSFLALMLILGICTISNYTKESFIYSKTLKNNDECLILIDNGKAAVIDFSSQNSSSFNNVINLLKKEHITQISSYVFTHYHYKLGSSLEKAASKIKINKVLLPMPKDETDISYAKATVDALKNRKVELEFYETNKEIFVEGYKDLSFYLEKFDFAINRHEYVFLIKFRRKNFIYAPPAITTESLITFSNKANVFILGNHGNGYSYDHPISCILPNNLSHLIASNGDAEYLYDFFDPLTDKTKVHDDNFVKLNMKK